MGLRLLVMAGLADYRMLVRKHVEIEWPDAVVVDHRLGEDPPLPVEFAATGYDAVIIVSPPPFEAAEALAAGFRAKPEFAPVILLLLDDAPPDTAPPAPGLQVIHGRKIDRNSLLSALDTAARERRQSLTRLRAKPGYDQRYRFGSVTIRGHRCIKQVGSGGMCTIYLAESERAGSIVVLKVFNQVPDISERLISFDRFIQEYEIVAGLKHRNIVQIYDLGVGDDHAYIAMEHFPDGDLRQRMKSPLSRSQAVDYFKQIASALEAIHSVGVLHRDLKPANIMLRGDGSVCLIDFGLAKADALDVELTGAREIFGTPYYMSPEQGHAEPIDARSDLYSLGIIFYEMLTGQKPYKGNSAMEVIYKHKRAELPVVPAEFAAFDPILRRLLAKAPEDRFQSARALLEAVAAVEQPA
jgi:tRNA A-37 threonylcarbamoyl transferase component Bud32